MSLRELIHGGKLNFIQILEQLRTSVHLLPDLYFATQFQTWDIFEIKLITISYVLDELHI